MAKATSSIAPLRHKPAMNVTPLVDVVLVLLIIFMVVIPAMDSGLNITVPGITNVDEKRDEKVKPFLLSVTKDGAVYLEEEKVPKPQLMATLRQASRREPTRRLVLRADREVPYGDVRPIYRTVQEVGFPGVSLRVNQRREDGAGH